jgi:hypothetical protein
MSAPAVEPLFDRMLRAVDRHADRADEWHALNDRLRIVDEATRLISLLQVPLTEAQQGLLSGYREKLRVEIALNNCAGDRDAEIRAANRAARQPHPEATPEASGQGAAQPQEATG